MAMRIRGDRLARFLEMTAPDEAGVTLDIIIQRMCGAGSANGECEGLPGICNDMEIPYGKVLTWLMADEKRYGEYKRALEVQSHLLMSEAIGIVDEVPNMNEKGAMDSGDIAWKKLRTDTRFRLAKYHAPEMYIDRKELNVEVRHDLAERLIAARDRLASGLAEREVIADQNVEIEYVDEIEYVEDAEDVKELVAPEIKGVKEAGDFL